MTAQGQNRLQQKGAIDLLILAVIALIAAAIPVTTSLIQQRQEVRKQAAEEAGGGGGCAACEVYVSKTCYNSNEVCDTCNDTCYETCYETCRDCVDEIDSRTGPRCVAWGDPYDCKPYNCNPYDCNPHDCNCRTEKDPYECGACEHDAVTPECNPCGAGDCYALCGEEGGTCEGTKPNCSCIYPPEPTATEIPTQIPTDVPIQGCSNPSGSVSQKRCEGKDLYECSQAGSSYVWEYSTNCPFDCFNGSCLFCFSDEWTDYQTGICQCNGSVGTKEVQQKNRCGESKFIKIDCSTECAVPTAIPTLVPESTATPAPPLSHECATPEDCEGEGRCNVACNGWPRTCKWSACQIPTPISEPTATPTPQLPKYLPNTGDAPPSGTTPAPAVPSAEEQDPCILHINNSVNYKNCQRAILIGGSEGDKNQYVETNAQGQVISIKWNTFTSADIAAQNAQKGLEQVLKDTGVCSTFLGADKTNCETAVAIGMTEGSWQKYIKYEGGLPAGILWTNLAGRMPDFKGEDTTTKEKIDQLANLIGNNSSLVLALDGTYKTLIKKQEAEKEAGKSPDVQETPVIISMAYSKACLLDCLDTMSDSLSECSNICKARDYKYECDSKTGKVTFISFLKATGETLSSEPTDFSCLGLENPSGGGGGGKLKAPIVGLETQCDGDYVQILVGGEVMGSQPCEGSCSSIVNDCVEPQRWIPDLCPVGMTTMIANNQEACVSLNKAISACGGTDILMRNERGEYNCLAADQTIRKANISEENLGEINRADMLYEYGFECPSGFDTVKESGRKFCQRTASEVYCPQGWREETISGVKKCAKDSLQPVSNNDLAPWETVTEYIDPIVKYGLKTDELVPARLLDPNASFSDKYLSAKTPMERAQVWNYTQNFNIDGVATTDFRSGNTVVDQALSNCEGSGFFVIGGLCQIFNGRNWAASQMAADELFTKVYSQKDENGNYLGLTNDNPVWAQAKLDPFTSRLLMVKTLDYGMTAKVGGKDILTGGDWLTAALMKTALVGSSVVNFNDATAWTSYVEGNIELNRQGIDTWDLRRTVLAIAPTIDIMTNIVPVGKAAKIFTPLAERFVVTRSINAFGSGVKTAVVNGVSGVIKRGSSSVVDYFRIPDLGAGLGAIDEEAAQASIRAANLAKKNVEIEKVALSLQDQVARARNKQIKAAEELTLITERAAINPENTLLVMQKRAAEFHKSVADLTVQTTETTLTLGKKTAELDAAKKAGDQALIPVLETEIKDLQGQLTRSLKNSQQAEISIRQLDRQITTEVNKTSAVAVSGGPNLVVQIRDAADSTGERLTQFREAVNAIVTSPNKPVNNIVALPEQYNEQAIREQIGKSIQEDISGDYLIISGKETLVKNYANNLQKLSVKYPEGIPQEILDTYTRIITAGKYVNQKGKVFDIDAILREARWGYNDFLTQRAQFGKYYLEDPKLAELIAQGTNAWHGSRSGSLLGVAEIGIAPQNAIKEKVGFVATGERVYGSSGYNDEYISFANIWDDVTALKYAGPGKGSPVSEAILEQQLQDINTFVKEAPNSPFSRSLQETKAQLEATLAFLRKPGKTSDELLREQMIRENFPVVYGAQVKDTSLISIPNSSISSEFGYKGVIDPSVIFVPQSKIELVREVFKASGKTDIEILPIENLVKIYNVGLEVIKPSTPIQNLQTNIGNAINLGGRVRSAINTFQNLINGNPVAQNLLQDETGSIKFGSFMPSFGNKKEIVIGRQGDLLKGVNDRAVSRLHASVAVEDGKIVVRDLGSKNGTFVNGKEIYGTVYFKQGDVLRVGNQTLNFQDVAKALNYQPEKQAGNVFQSAGKAVADAGENLRLRIENAVYSDPERDMVRPVREFVAPIPQKPPVVWRAVDSVPSNIRNVNDSVSSVGRAVSGKLDEISSVRQITIGRRGDLLFDTGNRTVSKNHAIAFLDNSGNVVIKDIGSSNGTYINGIRITEDTIVKQGDEIAFASEVVPYERIAAALRIPAIVPAARENVVLNIGKGAVQPQAVFGHEGVVQDIISVVDSAVAVADGVSSYGATSRGMAQEVADKVSKELDILNKAGNSPRAIADGIKQYADNLQSSIVSAKGGSTLAAVTIKDGYLISVRVGDAEARIIRGGKPYHIDNLTYVSGEPMFKGDFATPVYSNGEYAQAGKKNMPVQFQGTSYGKVTINSHVTMHQLVPGDRILVSSDGISKVLSESEIGYIVSRASNPGQAENDLVRVAMSKGLRDDYGVSVIFY